MHRGYIKDWRKSLDHPLFKKPLIWHFWGYCLKKAQHKDCQCFINGRVIDVKRGSFVFGRKRAAEETGLTERQIRTAILHLVKLQNLTIKSTNKYSIVSIVNWEAYQQDESKSDQQNDQGATKERPHTRMYKNEYISRGKSVFEIFSPEINRWDKPAVEKTIDGFILLRKTNQISLGVVKAEIDYWKQFSDRVVNISLQTYTEKRYWEQDKGEKYLRGIMRAKGKSEEKTNSRSLFQRGF